MQQSDNWHLQIQTGMELVEKQHLLDWKKSADSFCNLPLYEQGQYCKELKRRGDIVARQMEEQEARDSQQPVKPKSVSEKVKEWHQKQLKLK